MDLRHRPRRLRRTPALRRLARETRLHPADLIAPLFVEHGRGVRTPLPSLPGQTRWSPDTVVEEAQRLAGLGVGAVILFGLPAQKDARGTSGFDPAGPVPEALARLAKATPDLVLMADVCLCEYTDHGHCGVLAGGDVDNDATLPLLAAEAVAYARAGAHVVAPSAMMDGQVAAIRGGLDAAGLSTTAVLAYSAKSASAFYGPFRDAAGSTPGKGDRKGYQMDFANRTEALREVLLDVEEGADAVMVKPAGPNLDWIADAADAVDVPVAAYQVSGEYAALHAAADRGWLDLDRAAQETLVAIRRAGARWILTYFAGHAAEALRSGRWDRG
ncbi:MAG: porphobilinogen synthase [Planctomycetes bacterium]|nr:porphobilinogen synthase [Planctomycetota bacterium]